MKRSLKKPVLEQSGRQEEGRERAVDSDRPNGLQIRVSNSATTGMKGR